MPALRTSTAVRSSSAKIVSISILQDTGESETIYYPVSFAERAAFKKSTGKRVTEHQWNVYDFTKSIPSGKIATYADSSTLDILESMSLLFGPHQVGNALRNNPFAPYIPCHRVIASSLYIGGFVGEWGPDSKTKTQYHRKVAMLKDEGVAFTERGYLKDKGQTLWKGTEV
ncbi:hypothetical protein D9757_003009 [Collybiopsis confluens]|uniref:Methylated-DNA--protein-cysteine methyltransferase n=1 Tax=Collybiopsis confluens TaxID=2823264 RepID=A0A8H5HXT0_9AGAR|nr:hypothetical protein D9757_003009 [Collybiopsis confluens]